MSSQVLKSVRQTLQSWKPRLFWKIFVSVWSVSFVTMLLLYGAMAWVGDKQKKQEILSFQAEKLAEDVISRYEIGLPVGPALFDRFRKPDFGRPPSGREPFGFDDRRDLRPGHDPMRFDGERSDRRPPKIPFHLRIYDQQQKVWLLGEKQLDDPDQHDHQSGRLMMRDDRYRVEWELREEDDRLFDLLGLMFSVQIVAIMAASLLASWLLSSIIVRPIRQLDEHTQALAQGDWDHELGSALLARGDELGDLAKAIAQMEAHVANTLHGQQRLLQDVSHELRAPLARLQAAAGIAAQRWGEDDRLVARIDRECARLNLLISELLSLARLESGDLTLQTFDLRDLLRELVSDTQFAHKTHPINWQPAHAAQPIKGRALLERALSNLLNNACKHTPAGTQIDLTSEVEDREVVVRVRDHGAGVDEALLDKLFEPFVRATSESSGYGLGMSISKRAIERLSGTIRLQNHPEGGLMVEVRLPLAM